MTTPRIFVAQPLQSNATVRLEGDAANHVTRVLRLKVGAGLVLFNGQRGEFSAEIIEQQLDVVIARLGAFNDVNRESPLCVTLAQAVSRGERMTYTIQKAVELGVAEIQPLITQRCGVKLDSAQAARRRIRWQAIAVGACEQSGRTHIPTIQPLATIHRWLGPAYAAAAQPIHSPMQSVLRLVLDPTAPRGATELPRPSGSIALLVGPEGGLDPAEMALAEQCGFLGIQVGPRTLRTETAGPAMLAVLQTLWGDLA